MRLFFFILILTFNICKATNITDIVLINKKNIFKINVLNYVGIINGVLPVMIDVYHEKILNQKYSLISNIQGFYYKNKDYQLQLIEIGLGFKQYFKKKNPAGLYYFFSFNIDFYQEKDKDKEHNKIKPSILAILGYQSTLSQKWYTDFGLGVRLPERDFYETFLSAYLSIGYRF